jgi:ATP-dependent DNA helicase RecQ
MGTVVGHLSRYAAEGNALRPAGLKEAASLSQEQVDDVMTRFENRGADFLKPVFDELNGTVSYEELRLLRLYFENR